MRDGDPRQVLERLVVVEAAVGQALATAALGFVADDAAVAVVGILAHADVRHDDQLRRRCLEGADALLHNALGGKVLEAHRVLVLRQAEEDHSGHAQLHQLGRLGRQLVDGEMVHARHRRDLLSHALAVQQEEGMDEIVGREGRLAHQAPQVLVRAQPPWAIDRVLARAFSISLTKMPCPPSWDSGVCWSLSPPVRIGRTCRPTSGWAARSAAATVSLCAKASELPRVPMTNVRSSRWLSCKAFSVSLPQEAV